MSAESVEAAIRYSNKLDEDWKENCREKDPNGLTPGTPGAKLDQGKPKAAQILGMFSRALWQVSLVGTNGAAKYSMGGWQFVEDGFNRYDDAGMRHFLKRGMGEEIDPDFNLLHLSHEAWNALAKLELYLRARPYETTP